MEKEVMRWERAVEILELHNLFVNLEEDIDLVTKEELSEAIKVVVRELIWANIKLDMHNL